MRNTTICDSLSTAPELGGQEDEDGEEFEPSEEHVEGEDQLCRAWELREERGVTHGTQGRAQDAPRERRFLLLNYPP